MACFQGAYGVGLFKVPGILAGSPSSALLSPFLSENSPTEIDYGKKLVPTYSNLSSGGPAESVLG